MIFCRYCGKEIHEEAPSCPQCGGVQQPAAAVAPVVGEGAGALWMAITSLVLGLLCTAALWGDAEHDKETLTGLGMFLVGGLVLGVISLVGKKAGKGMAIAGVALSSFALLVLLGSF